MDHSDYIHNATGTTGEQKLYFCIFVFDKRKGLKVFWSLFEALSLIQIENSEILYEDIDLKKLKMARRSSIQIDSFGKRKFSIISRGSKRSMILGIVVSPLLEG